MKEIQIEFNFTPVRIVKNKWTDIWHVMMGHLVWPEDTEQICFQSIQEAVAFAKSHGANPQVVQ
jgi:hypothetical protein